MECTNYNSNLDVKDVKLGLDQIFDGRPRVNSIESEDSKKQTSLSNYDSDKDFPPISYHSQTHLLCGLESSKHTNLRVLASRCVKESLYAPLSHNLYITDSEEELNDDILEDLTGLKEITLQKERLSDDAIIACYRKNCSRVMKVELYSSVKIDKQGVASYAVNVQNLMNSLREARRRINVSL